MAIDPHQKADGCTCFQATYAVAIEWRAIFPIKRSFQATYAVAILMNKEITDRIDFQATYAVAIR